MASLFTGLCYFDGLNCALYHFGREKTQNEEEADILGVVACSVRQKSIDKVYHKINVWNKWKEKKNLLTFVSGCILPEDKEKFLKRFDLLFSMKEITSLPDMIKQYGVVTPLSTATLAMVDREEEAFSEEYFSKVRPSYGSNFEAFIPIQNGCDKFCTFCAVPYTRGREVSRPSEDILQEIESLLDKDYKSITLLGQNVNSYGLDKGGEEISFAQLLRSIGELGIKKGKKFWTYFTSPHPRDMTREVLEVIAQYEVLAKQVHLPLQSGDDKVLIKMNRNHSVDRYRSIISNIKELLPTATLSTDFIVGFTGETREQFQASAEAMKEFNYQMAYISLYSPRPGAASSRWVDDIPMDEKKKRLHELNVILRKSSLEFNQRLIGQRVKTLVEGQDKKEGYLAGRTEGKIVLRFKSDNLDLVGNFVYVKISSAVAYSMEGELEPTSL